MIYLIRKSKFSNYAVIAIDINFLKLTDMLKDYVSFLIKCYNYINFVALVHLFRSCYGYCNNVNNF